MSLLTLAAVKVVSIVSNSTSSIVQFGDRKSSYLNNKGIAVQRNKTIYKGDEPEFLDYELFSRPIPLLYNLLPQGKIYNHRFGKLLQLPINQPSITVNKLKVISNSTSSNVQIGNSCSLHAINRQKAIRQTYNT